MNRYSNVYNETIPKMYWSIGEVAAELGVNSSCIRFWQAMFGFGVHRSPRGARRFTVEEVKKVRRIHYLLNVEMYTIEGAKRRLKLDAEQADDFKEMEATML